ncbi:MAG: PASTA domain-containing protein [Ignavibacteriaceae bacterium]|nr:PASTA domain-containing protein [Ignavibacteriaceae bacterium]
MKKYLKKALIALTIFLIILVLLDLIILPWYVSSPEVAVPNVVGKSEEQAISILSHLGFDPKLADTTYDTKYPEGIIFHQKPQSGKLVKKGRIIYLFLSGGEKLVKVPQLKGKNIRDAKFALERVGLSLGNIEELESNQPKDMIFDQEYIEGSPLKKGSTVGVSVSIGIGGGEIIVPNLIGKSLAEAQIIIKDSSFAIGKINYQPSSTLLPNTVIDQYPTGGNKLNKGDKIDLFVTRASVTGEETLREE